MKKRSLISLVVMLVVAVMVFGACAPAEEAAPVAEEAAPVAEEAAPAEEVVEEEPATEEEAPAEEPEAQATQSVQVAQTSNDEVIAAAKESGVVSIGMSIPQLANPYFVSVRDGVQNMADEFGYDLTVVDAGYDVAKQVSDFENFMNQGVTAVIACPIDSNALMDITQEMNEKGILVISFAQLVPNANAIFTLDEYSYGVTIGTNVAQWINEELDGQGNVLIISQDNVEAVVKRADGIEDTILELAPDSVIVARQAGDNPESGMRITEDVMQAHPEVNVIVGNNDAGPLGAIEAVNAMNLDPAVMETFFVGGADATPEAIAKMAEEGSVYRATVDLAPYVTGQQCVEAINEIIESGTVPVGDGVVTSNFIMDPVWQEDVLNGWTSQGS